MSDLILHHYPESPYAEKIRTLLGYKGAVWQSVLVPRIAPKPEMTALTGGYRKVPVLQIGADVYCDTRLISEVIEQRLPTPPALTTTGRCNDIVAHWVDLNLFGRAVAYTFGRNVDRLPDVFLADRAALRGAPLERDKLKAAVPLAEQELATQIQWIESALSGSSPFINGPHPGSGDFTLYATLWFAQNGQFDFSRFGRVLAWLARMKAFGHGTSTELSAQDALGLAARSQPAPLPHSPTATDACGAAIGQRVRVTPEQLGHGTSVEGALMAISPEQLTVQTCLPQGHTVHVHFPRVGYRVKPLA